MGLTYELFRRLGWTLSQVFYHAKGYGCRYIQGPALIVFADHPTSLDPVLAGYLHNYTSPVYREHRFNPLTRVARAVGGISVGKKRDGLRFDKERFDSVLDRGEVVGMFPYSGVNGHPKKGVIERAMKFERNNGPINYVPASVRYRSLLHRQLYIPGSDWPMVLITHAEIFIGTPILSEGHSPESLLTLLQNKGRELQER